MPITRTVTFDDPQEIARDIRTMSGMAFLLGTVHGGWYGAVLDAPLGVALHTLLPAGVGYTTLEYKVNLVKGVRPDTGVLRASSHVVHKGRTTAVTEARLEDARGVLYAYASATQLILDR
jgi:uncharacterized protein (TIGR00369 family)